MNIKQKFKWLKNKWVKRIFIFFFALPLLILSILIIVVYWKQDYYVQLALEKANDDLNGKIVISDSHVSLFENFPYISIDLEGFRVFESKENDADCIMHLEDVYVGFNVLDMLTGDYKIKRIKLKGGHIDSKQHADGSLNIERALASKVPSDQVEEDLHLELNSIIAEAVDISHLDEVTNVKVDAMIGNFDSKFTTNDENTQWSVNTDFVLSVLDGSDSTFFRNKKCILTSNLSYSNATQLLNLEKTVFQLEKTQLEMKGNLECKDDFTVNLELNGQKPDFNLFLSFAPPEYSEALKGYENKGDIYINALVRGKTLHGNNPKIDVRFGCSEGLIRNQNNEKKINSIGFEGYFTNGSACHDSTSLFYVKNIQLKPEVGQFQGDIWIKNFKTPEIKMDVRADLDLDFLSKFSQAKSLSNVAGKVFVSMRFHDLVDLEHPERILQRFSDSYESEIKIDGLRGKFEDLPFPITNLNLSANSRGCKVELKNLSLNFGSSDLQVSGTLSDLPAIIHHSSSPVDINLNVNSKFLDFTKIILDDKKEVILDDQVKDLKVKMNFKTSAKAITESKNLPQGFFQISEASGKFQQYPHAFRDLHLELLIDEVDLFLKTFRGKVDHSDFNVSGKFHHYDFWFQPTLVGKGELELALHSKHLIFKELFSYAGYNHMPEEYQSEELMNFDFIGHAAIEFDHGLLNKLDLQLDKLSGKLKSHPVALHHFSGLLSYNKDLLTFNHLKGGVGNSDIDINGNYHLTDSKHRSKIQLKSKKLDLNALLSGTHHQEELHGDQHDKEISLYDYSFPNLDVKVDIGHFAYAPYELKNLHFDAQIYEDHHIDIHHLKVNTAEGSISGSGTFSGKDKMHIYFAPKLSIHHLNLDKFMLKFDNFGQDHLVSENLHGYANGTIKGKIHLHADFVPKLDDSELEINVEVTNGRLQNYAPLIDLGTYFENRDVSNVKFDTLTNVFRLKNGKLSIPEMVICSSLGFLKISGEQSMSGNMPMQYQVGIPWSMIKEVAKNKLFKSKQKDTDNDDDIVVEEKNAKYIYFKVDGDLDNYKVSIVRKKKRS